MQGLPHLQIGKNLRFIENDVMPWYKVNCPTQEEIEKPFVDAPDKIKCIERWLPGEAFVTLKNKMVPLYREMKGKLKFVYYKSIKNQHGFTSILYSNAHTLSRRYSNDIIEGHALDAKFVTDAMISPVRPDCSQTKELEISLDHTDGTYAHFIVAGNGEKRKIKSNCNIVLKGALELALQLKVASPEISRICIKKIPNFTQDIKNIFGPTMLHTPKRIRDLLNALRANIQFSMEDDLQFHINQHFNLPQVS